MLLKTEISFSADMLLEDSFEKIMNIIDNMILELKSRGVSKVYVEDMVKALFDMINMLKDEIIQSIHEG